MFVWCAILFVLGILAFVDSLFNMGEVFRRANSILFMLISLGLLIRTTTKIKSGKIEDYEKRVFVLEQCVKALEKQNQETFDY